MKKFYHVQCFYHSEQGYLAYTSFPSRRMAKRYFGTLRTKYPDALVTLNQMVKDGRGVWSTRTYHEKDGSK